MRKSIKKPATDFAQLLLMKELYRLKAEGQDPVACVEQSLVNCWCDFYALKEKKANRVSTSEVARTTAALQADELSARGIEKRELAENARALREKFGRKPPTQGELH
jgi:hypothetical protein